jgi:hypothetical protein
VDGMGPFRKAHLGANGTGSPVAKVVTTPAAAAAIVAAAELLTRKMYWEP